MSEVNKRLIFVTGASRSGTTLLSFVLRNHSRVFGLKELDYFGTAWDPRRGRTRLSADQAVDAAAQMVSRQDQGVFAGGVRSEDRARAAALVARLGDAAADPARLFAEVVTQFTAEGGKEIPCEQTPRNIFYAERLLEIYPEARIVHMVRDPRAVMASQKSRWRKRRLAKDQTFVPFWHSVRVWVNYHPYTVAKMWRRASQEARRLAGHPRFMALKFEDLLSEPEASVRALCAHLGLEYEPGMLSVGQVNSSHASSVGGARTGLRKDAIDAWRERLSSGEALIADRICGPVMQHFGYAPSPKKPVDTEFFYRLTYPLHLAGVLAINPRRAWIQGQAVWSKYVSRPS